jgi:hypothetical protein
MQMMGCECVLHAFNLVWSLAPLLKLISVKKLTLKRMGLSILLPYFVKNIRRNATLRADLRQG